jgi:AraC-like DNA-binding protein
MEEPKPAATATALVSPALNVWRALEARGMDPEAVFRAAGVDPAALRVPGARVPVRAAQRLWRVIDDAVPDPAFGIEVAKQMYGTALHAVGYTWLSSATLGEAARRLARYFRVLSEVWSLQIDDDPRGIRMSFVFAAPSRHPSLWLHDWLAAGFVRLSRITYGEAFAPIEVTVVRSAPDPRAPFDEWFRCPIVWSAERTSVLCRREDLAQPLVTANPEVALANERVALEYLERLDRADIVAQVRRRTLELLPSGPPTQAEIARGVALSPRTLHRRLAEAGTSFAKLLDDTRRELAAGYLQRADYSIAEVAYLVGFAEVSSFNRAFRRWTGKSPSEVRRGLDAGDSRLPDAKGVAS